MSVVFLSVHKYSNRCPAIGMFPFPLWLVLAGFREERSRNTGISSMRRFGASLSSSLVASSVPCCSMSCQSVSLYNALLMSSSLGTKRMVSPSRAAPQSCEMISFGRRWYCTPHILGTGSYEQIISAGGDAEKTLHRGSTPDNGGDLMQPLNDPATWFDREFKLAVPVEVLRNFLEGKLPHCKDHVGVIVENAQRSSSATGVSSAAENFRNARKINDENLLKIRQHTPLEVLQSGASTLCGRKWLATSDSVTTFKSRNLESIYVSLVPDVWASQNSLPLIAGERQREDVADAASPSSSRRNWNIHSQQRSDCSWLERGTILNYRQ